MEITLVRGDITEQQVDAVVNAANSSLMGGGGVDGAIHRKGGKAVLDACRALRASQYGRGLPVGQAVATPAGRLPARWVIHTVGPVYRPNAPDLAELTGQLASCYRESLRVAEELGARSVALPAVSTGVFGWPMESAARIALRVARAHAAEEAAGIAEARFVLWSDEALETFQRVWDELLHGTIVD